MGKKVRIVLAEDHTLLRQGLRALLSTDPGFEIVGEACDGREAVRCVEKLKPDLLLMDLSMPRMNGMEAIREIKNRHPQTRVIALTVHQQEEYLVTTLQAGAEGYVLKDATHEELVLAIQSVMAGNPYLSPAVSGKIITGYLERKNTTGSIASGQVLSPREREVLKLIAEGYRNREIAAELCISLKTVEKHRANLMKKLDLHNTAALTVYAVEKGLVHQ